MAKILIVDDSEKWVQFHKFNIKELFGNSVEIECSNSAREGVDKLIFSEDQPFDLILTEIGRAHV